MARPKMRKDLTGKRFGRLTAKYVDEERSENGKIYWWCDCDCGNKVSVQSTRLTRKKGGTKSCGCARNSAEAVIKARTTRISYPKDITGMRFGRLIVKRKTNIKSERASDNGTYFFFDKEDYDKIKNYSWWYDGRYVIAHSLKDDKYSTDIIRMHRVVMDISDREDIEVDHKNLIRYDCRKTNLRKAITSENSRNKDFSYLSPTGVVGVKKENSKWLASIKINKEILRLGLFENFDDAVKSRKEAEIKLFGEFRFDMSNKDIIDENNMDKYKTLKSAI